MALISSSVRGGIRLSLPVILGYLPVGFAFGVLAVQSGMTPLTVGIMSWLVYAGSAQIIAVGMLSAGAGVVSIIVTTFIVNLRHLLMSAALAPHLREWSKPLQAWFAFELTDETFAVNLGQFTTRGVFTGEVFTFNGIAHNFWTAGSVAGALFGDVIGNVKPYGLDFALPGMFMALLLPHLRLTRRLLAACLAALFSVTLAVLGIGQWNVMLATAMAATIAAFAPLPRKPSPPGQDACPSPTQRHGGGDA